jgi:hypothetical protein
MYLSASATATAKMPACSAMYSFRFGGREAPSLVYDRISEVSNDLGRPPRSVLVPDLESAGLLLPAEPVDDLGPLVLAVLWVLGVGEENGLTDISDQVQLNRAVHQRPDDLEVPAVEVLNLVYVDDVVKVAEPVKRRAVGCGIHVKCEACEVPAVGPLLLVQEPCFARRVLAGVSLEVQAT